MAEQMYDWDDEFDPEAIDRIGPEEGCYHFAVVAVDEDGGRSGEMILDLEVLAGTTPGQEGRVHREYLTRTIKAMKRFHSLAIALGFVTVDQLKAMKESGERPAYDFTKAVGRQICAEIVSDTYQGKTKLKCGFNFYHPTHPRVEKWPKNAAMLKRAGIAVEQAKEADHSVPFKAEQRFEPAKPNTDNALDGVI
jgi:hypothetical protein